MLSRSKIAVFALLVIYANGIEKYDDNSNSEPFSQLHFPDDSDYFSHNLHQIDKVKIVDTGLPEQIQNIDAYQPLLEHLRRFEEIDDLVGPTEQLIGYSNTQDHDAVNAIASRANNGSSDNSQTRHKRNASRWPRLNSVNLDVVNELNPSGQMRGGQATDTHSCYWVRSVPKDLNMDLPAFYKKYTEAYGIPVVGSASVTSAGLRRACYIVRVMFASRFDIRQAYYKFSGRIGLIADNEQTTSLPEHQNLTESWDSTTRGLGATPDTPLSSVGDDNMRCCCGDRYPKQDILIHELAHGIHLIGASFVIPGFNLRLHRVYKTAMKKGKWQNTYAATNKREYWAVGAQLYFNSFDKKKMKFGEITVFDERSLRAYDRLLWLLLRDVFSCKNELVPRCGWRSCSPKSFVLVASTNDQLQSGCKAIKTVDFIGLHACMDLACSLLAHGVAMKGSKCRVLKCPSRHDFKLTQTNAPEMIYRMDKLPQMDLAKEDAHVLKMECGNPPLKGRCKVWKSERRQLGGDHMSAEQCGRCGGCYDDSTCYYPQQDCLDRDHNCPGLADNGECRRNPAYMYRICQISCDVCDLVTQLDLDRLSSHCQDRSPHCKTWKEWGECKRIPTFMGYNCPLSCRKCKVIDPLMSDALLN